MSEYKLPKNHTILVSIPDIREICNPIAKEYGISYFNHIRIYQTGHITFLATDDAVINLSFQKGSSIIPPLDPALIKDKYYHLMLSETALGSFYEGLREIEQILNVNNGIILVKKNKDYYDIFGFASLNENYDKTNFYLNNLDILEQFTLYYKEKAKVIIKRANKDRLLLPPSMQPSLITQKNISSCKQLDSKDKFLTKITPRKYVLSGEYQHITLTKREYDCLKYLYFGRSAKEIAAILNISSRTVESYLNNIKDKVGVNKKSQLIDFVFETQLF